MIELAIAFGAGLVVGAIVLYFIARNNKEKAIKYLMKDLKHEADVITARIMAELASATEETKTRISALLDSLQGRMK